MNKDVIYIDVEDDITSIIGKVKDAKEKIVALVPPKRIGVLQSAVNLRLLARAATQGHKHLVLISSNSALTSLAAAAKIPVAKNLQSKPELAEISALDIDDGEDIIDGNTLPIGELEKTADTISLTSATNDASIEDALRADAMAPHALPPSPGQTPTKARVKSGIKVPSFTSFRKKLILMICGSVVLVLFLVWALVYAPQATVIITARTNNNALNTKVTLSTTGNTDVTTNTVKATAQQAKKDGEVDFDATGTKDIGTKATGSMKLTRTSVSSTPIDVPTGTTFTDPTTNEVFVSTSAATLAGTTIGVGGVIQDSATVTVTANGLGDQYNLSARSYQANVSGFNSTGSDMSGGTKSTAQVVSSDDIQKATATLVQQNSDAMKSQLKSEFGSSAIPLDATFKVDPGTITSTPAQDQVLASGTKPKITATVTYTMTGVAYADASQYLDTYFKSQMTGTSNQRVYDNGSKGVTFTNVMAMDAGGFSANINATGKIGPMIDDTAIKNLAKGKRYGDIQSSIESIQGVDNVDTKFWPFWVSSAPNDINRISVQFNLNESK